MISFILWYLAIGAIGWLAFPLGFRLLRFLPDRGATLMKPLGLLCVGFIFWSLASFHVLQNDPGGVLLSLIILAGLSWLAGRGQFGEMRAWLSEKRRVIIIAEVLFLVAFAAWAVVRAAVPEASGTEKPMELAFINAIMRSTFFPAHDPWLSGYGISYYYFGYVLVAMLAKLTGQAGSVAFNLGLASWFGLVAVTTYGLLDNLLDLRKKTANASHLAALLAPLFVLLLSNLVGPLEVLHAADAFWQPGSAEIQPGVTPKSVFPPIPDCLSQPASQQHSSFWSWLDLQELNCPPAPPYRGIPARNGGIWWWRSSRVLTDYDLNNAPREVIDEFPAFSYLLGDLHPHVLSMPFVLLAVGLALNLYLFTLRKAKAGLTWLAWLRSPEFWLAAVVLGGLSFLNTWDFPIYLALYVAAYSFACIQTDGWKWSRGLDFAILAGELGLAGILLYLPFYIGFASQAGGIIPSLSFFSRGVHFWVMFGTLLIPILFWLLSLPAPLAGNRRFWLLRGLSVAAALVFGLWLLSYAFGALLLALPGKAELLVSLQGGVDGAVLLAGSLMRRLSMPGMWLSMLGLLALVFAAILSAPTSQPSEDDPQSKAGETSASPSNGFVILLVLVGSGLVLFPEFFYLRDQFGWRMNTIFKFYFQAWMLWAVAAAYASVYIWQERSLRFGWAMRAALVVLVALGLIYSAYLIPDRAQSFKPQVWSLDGADYIRRYNPDEYDAILWLQKAPEGVLAEAIGGSYDAGYARIATHTGLPTVLGWPGHESQWRGGAAEIGSRQVDIETLYQTTSWDKAREIIQRYQIRYIYVGSAESGKYRVGLDKFVPKLRVAFQAGAVIIYEVPGILP